MERAVYVLDGARTAFGGFGGALSGVTATALGTAAARAALEKSDVAADLVDNVVFGNVIQSHNGSAYLARHVALDAGVPVAVPALTVNRLCGSGLQAVVTAAKDILLGESFVALAGGAESMSMTPYLLRGVRFGMRMGNGTAVDMLNEVLTDCRGDIPMGITAENLAQKYQISRAEQDEFALLSHQRAARAREAGRFAAEIVPVSVPGRKGPLTVSDDEHIRPDTSLESLSKLRPAFLSSGTVTAGNASGINDGAAAVILAGETAVRQHGWSPKARIVSFAVAGVDPAYMGIGPVPAIRKALQQANLDLEQIALWEVNEAFAAQYLSVERELGLPRERTNVNGGAIALGHPVGASGARILLTLIYELHRRGERFGVASLCIGGGQGIAMVVEAV
ncbi:acetyl-CoA C-acetyltransferase [Alicyclobacillus contaminans]|uniref:acetyl-CoA C-acetyltransferase n=1 Tax=Alicyclobacillus contaminans TaxID=392016 RepID=UPI00047D267E|nr:acetyl-CoA C-acetyltransferase [Alicyclobacillus contaminans]